MCGSSALPEVVTRSTGTAAFGFSRRRVSKSSFRRSASALLAGPRLAPPEFAGNYSERSKYERHPRSAVGWNATHFYMVIVDGRQPGLSMGMKLAELADYFLKLGCTDAMNFDGGKSAQMWMDGRIMNSPCQGEDTVASSLLVLRKPAGR